MASHRNALQCNLAHSARDGIRGLMSTDNVTHVSRIISCITLPFIMPHLGPVKSM